MSLIKIQYWSTITLASLELSLFKKYFNNATILDFVMFREFSIFKDLVSVEV